jgi:hypothetical protein
MRPAIPPSTHDALVQLVELVFEALFPFLFGVPGAEPPAPRFYGKHVVSRDLVLVYTRTGTGFAVVLMVVVRYNCTLVAVSPAWIAGPIAGSRVLRAGSVIVVINLAH